MSEATVRVKGLVKRYGTSTAVKEINLQIEKGEVFGLLGPNGAGKTTTLECMEGMRSFQAGIIDVAGCNPKRDRKRLRKKLGVQMQSFSLPDSMRVSEALRLICAYGKAGPQYSLIEKFGFEKLMGKQYKELSTGQKRRLHLVLALVCNPEVVILDEPTAGLDVQSKAQLHDEIRKIRAEGVTVLIATHDMAEAEELCDHIAIMISGKIAVCGTPEEVTAAGDRETRIRLRTSKGLITADEPISGAKLVREKDGYLEWKCRDTAESVFSLLSRVQELSDTVEDLRVERPSLEERFLELVEGSKKNECI